jgi:hypothetical protein
VACDTDDDVDSWATAFAELGDDGVECDMRDDLDSWSGAFLNLFVAVRFVPPQQLGLPSACFPRIWRPAHLANATESLLRSTSAAAYSRHWRSGRYHIFPLDTAAYRFRQNWSDEDSVVTVSA